jgi:hypothetical protein
VPCVYFVFENSGTGLRAGAMVKVPQVSGRADFKELMGAMKLQARGGAGVDSESKGGKKFLKELMEAMKFYRFVAVYGVDSEPKGGRRNR